MQCTNLFYILADLPFKLNAIDTTGPCAFNWMNLLDDSSRFDLVEYNKYIPSFPWLSGGQTLAYLHAR